MMVISSLRSHAEPSMTRRHNSTRNMSQVVPLALASSASARGSFAARGDAPRGVRARRLLSTPPKVGTGISCTSVPGRGAGGGGGEGEEGDTPAPTSALGSGGVCDEPTPLGRIKIGLYGALVPQTVENFLKLLPPSAGPGEGYLGTIFHRITPGGFILGGQPGSHRLGQVQTPRLPSNPELLSSKAFEVPHLRPGTVSLALGAAAGASDGAARAQTEFLITTGPAPVPSLDGENIVFGRVLEGMDVVAAVAAVPTFAPSAATNARAWNKLAETLGDDRAAKARSSWSKPTQAIVIYDAGILE